MSAYKEKAPAMQAFQRPHMKVGATGFEPATSLLPKQAVTLTKLEGGDLSASLLLPSLV